MPTKDIIERAMETIRFHSAEGYTVNDEFVEDVITEALRTQRQEIIAELKGMNHSMGDKWRCTICLSNEEWRTLRDNLIKKLEE